MEINIGIIGLGTIGAGVASILKKNSSLIEKRSGIKVHIKKACDLDEKAFSRLKLDKKVYTKKADELLNDPGIDIVIELIGGYEPARTFILKALKNGKSVITANKAVLAKHGPELFKAAKENKANIMFEAAVGGCIPIIRSLQRSYISESFNSIYGILNGTTNYILTKINEGLTYKEALEKAQKLGFAEPDPSFDVEGKDAAQKLVILSSLAFNSKIKDDIYTEGITKLEKIDIDYAAELGYVVKLLAIAKIVQGKLELRVHPTMIPKSHGLASVSNELNAVYVVGENIKDVMLYGRGAGQLPTATVVIGDIISIARRLENKAVIEPLNYFNDIPVKDINDTESRYYLRYHAVDKPGVLAKITEILGKNNISISGVWQKEENKEIVPLVMTTHKAVEKNIRRAVEEINKLDIIRGKTVVIRIEDFR